MIPNLLHCAIIGNRPTGDVLDYVPPEYTDQKLLPDEVALRTVLLGAAKVSDQAANYASVIYRDWLRQTQLRDVAEIFGIEGGYSLSELKATLFETYKPQLSNGLKLSPAAIKHRSSLYAVHNIICDVDSSTVDLELVGVGRATGSTGEDIQLPGFATGATVRVTVTDGQLTGTWATRPKRTVDSISKEIATAARAPMLSLTTLPGPLDSSKLSSLFKIATTYPVAIDCICAATLILANAVAHRLQ